MFSDSDKEAILEIAESKGFSGVVGDKARVMGRKVAMSSFIKTADFKNELVQRKMFELAILVEREPYQLEAVLKSKKALTPSTGENGGEIYDSVESTKHGKIYVDKILIVKTSRISDTKDPGFKKSDPFALLAFNTSTKQLLNPQTVSINGILHAKGLTRDDVIRSPDTPHVWPRFNPYIPDLKYYAAEEALGGEKVLCLNTAVPPKWMTNHSPNVKPGVKGYIKKLIYHLFPQEEDREKVLDWCHYAIFKRNGTVLCLAGARASGKSTFASLLGDMVGRDFTENVAEAVLQDKFNNQFHNKRLLVFEEVAIDTAQAINKIKAWCNNKISIEAKGTNAFSAENFSSMIFLLNNLAELKVEAQERRFSIPVVAKDPLETSIPQEETAAFKKGADEESQEYIDQLAEFGLFLRNRKPKYSENTPIKGEHYWVVADMALSMWKLKIKNYIVDNGQDGEVIDLSSLDSSSRGSFKESGEAKAGKIPNRRDTIDNFLRDYLYLGKYRLGKTVDLDVDRNARTHRGTRRNYGILPDSGLMSYLERTKRAEDLL